MIPTLLFIVIGILIIACAAYYFIIGDNGPIPFADMLACIAGLFLSIFSAVNVAAGNVGDSMYVVASSLVDNVTTQAPVMVSVPVIDGAVAWLFIAAAIMFLALLVYSISNMLRDKKWKESL